MASFREANCDTVHFLVAAKVRETLTVSKEVAQNFDVEIFNLRNLSELEVRKQYQIKISNKFAALENLNDSEDINRTCENIKQSIKTSDEESLFLNEFKQHKPWLDAKYLGFLDQMKHAKMQWSQVPNQSNADTISNV